MPHDHIRAGRMLGTAALTASSLLGFAAAAQAADPVSYSCRGSAVTVQVAGGATDDPVRAGNDAGTCTEAVAGLPALTESVGLSRLATARTAYAATNPGGFPPIKATPQAVAGVEGLDLAGIPAGTLSVGAARSTVSASCVAGAPAYTGRSEVANLTLGGQPLVLDGVVQPLTDAVSDALGAIVSVRLNEQVDLPGGGKAVRAAHVKLLALDGSGAPLADVIVAESRLSNNGTVCDPNSPPNNGDDPGDGDDDTSGLCPAGSVLDVSRKVCIIPAPGTRTTDNPTGDIGSSSAVIIGAPFEGPKGGRVITLAEARQRFPTSPCVRGKGLRYVVLGNARSNRITGTNGDDRIMGLAGSDKLDGGRGDDCVEGGTGRDHVSGAQDDDRVWGGRGNDALNGNSGDDRLRAGRGNDTIDAGYGKDRAWGQGGDDAINIANAGPRQMADGGRGFDVVRANPEDRVRKAERRYRVVRSTR